MKKRLLTILICTALILQCTACGSSGNTETVQVIAETETTPQNDHSGIYGTAGEVSAYDTENSNYTLTVNAGETVHEISDTLFGIFIEDINFAADGGLYAEMVQNRSFEFTKLASGNERHAWSDVGSITANVRSEDGLNENNPNYMSLENSSGEKAGIANKGFLDGMAVTEGASYDVSAYIRGIDGYTGGVYFAIGNENWGDTFFEKYRAFAEAFVQAKKENPGMYGDIGLIFTADPDVGDGSSDTQAVMSAGACGTARYISGTSPVHLLVRRKRRIHAGLRVLVHLVHRFLNH